MLNSYGNFIKAWEFLITILLIYDFHMVPFILTFREFYETKTPKNLTKGILKDTYAFEGLGQRSLRDIELAIDCFCLFDIIANFFKW